MPTSNSGSRFWSRWAIRDSGNSSLLKALLDLEPEAVAFFPFGEVEVGREFGKPLGLDGVEVLVVVLDDLLLNTWP